MNAFVMTLLPNKSALPRRPFDDCAGTGCGLKRKLSSRLAAAATGGAEVCEENAEEKSANSEVGATGALTNAGVFAGASLPPKADAKSPKSAEVSPARGSKSSMGFEAAAAELKISSIISLLLLEPIGCVTIAGSSPNKFSLCVLRCVGELIPKSLDLP